MGTSTPWIAALAAGALALAGFSTWRSSRHEARIEALERALGAAEARREARDAKPVPMPTAMPPPSSQGRFSWRAPPEASAYLGLASAGWGPVVEEALARFSPPKDRAIVLDVKFGAGGVIEARFVKGPSDPEAAGAIHAAITGAKIPPPDPGSLPHLGQVQISIAP